MSVLHRRLSAVLLPLLAIVFLVSFVRPVAAHVSYMPGDPEVERLAELYAAAGRVFPAASFPIAKRDLVRYALRIEDARPDLSGLVGEYLELLDYRPGEVMITADLDIDFEAYFRSRDVFINEELQYDGLEFYRRYLSMPDFLALTLYGEKDDTSGMYIRAGIRRRYERGELLDTNFLEFHTDRLIRADNYFIRRGYFYHYFGDLEVLFGRNALHLGVPDFSTFMASDRLPHVDALTLRYRLGPIHMTSVSATLDNRRASGERDLRDGWDPQSEGFDPSDPLGMAGNGHPVPETVGVWPEDRLGWGNTIIYYGVHRFDYLRERLRLGIASQQFVTRENNAFHLADAFPVFSWHNTDVGPHNMSLIMDVSWIPFPRTEFFFQAGYNDINATELVGIPDAAIPTIDAYLGGVSYRGPVGKRRFRGTAEVGYTHFLWGNFYDYNDEKGNYLARGVYRFRTHGIYMMPMTAPYGPGVVWTRWKGNLAGFAAGPGSVDFGLDVEVLSRKDRELVNLVDTVYDPADDDYSMYEDATTELIWRVAPRVTYNHPGLGSYFLEPSLNGWEDERWVEVTLGGYIALRWRGAYTAQRDVTYESM